MTQKIRHRGLANRPHREDERQIPEWPTSLPVPEVIEDDSEAAWEMWLAANRGDQSWEADTAPMGLREE